MAITKTQGPFSHGINDGANATAITIEADGDVGIGTTSPQEQLHVYTTADARIEAESTTGIAGLKVTNNQGSYAWYVDSSADKFHLYDFTDSANRLTLDGAGNVGIGTTSPTGALTISKASSDNAINLIRTGSNTANAWIWANSNKIRFGDDNSGNPNNTRMAIDVSTGNVGIGTTAPGANLEIKDGVSILRFQSSSNAGYGQIAASSGTLYYSADSGNTQSSSAHIFNIDGSQKAIISSNGYVGIGTSSPSEKLNVSGNILATGNVTAYSDERLKSDIETLDGSKVFEMRGVSFTKDGESSSGVIAQELHKVAPELVNDSGEYMSVAYGNLVGYLIEAVKELKAEVDALKAAK